MRIWGKIRKGRDQFYYYLIRMKFYNNASATHLDPLRNEPQYACQLELSMNPSDHIPLDLTMF